LLVLKVHLPREVQFGKKADVEQQHRCTYVCSATLGEQATCDIQSAAGKTIQQASRTPTANP
jgi:hypothetical protein